MAKIKPGKNHPAYNLRINKAVDRLLLVEVLRELEYDKRNDCVYYSLAGPFLEDLRVMDRYFPRMRLNSIESDEQTYHRQMFHQFNSRLEILNFSFHDFLLLYEPGDTIDIFWLDYTDLSCSCLQEFQELLKKVPDGSVVRITLRAEPDLNIEVLKDRISPSEFDRLSKQLTDEFLDKFKTFLPHNPDPQPYTYQGYAKMVQDMVKRAASQALDTTGSNRDYLPIQTTRYNDNTQMLSVTGIVYCRDQKEAMCQKLQSVRFCNFDWKNEPEEINIPNLSLKERLRLEKLLPVLSNSSSSGDALHKELGYCIVLGVETSIKQLSRYADYYRDYPNFIRVDI